MDCCCLETLLSEFYNLYKVGEVTCPCELLLQISHPCFKPKSPAENILLFYLVTQKERFVEACR